MNERSRKKTEEKILEYTESSSRLKIDTEILEFYLQLQVAQAKITLSLA